MPSHRTPHRASKADVVAFRLAAHGLIGASGGRDLLDAAGRCGVQNSPPGSALLALFARARTTKAAMTRAVDAEKTLLQSWCMRGAPFFFPTSDAAVFTTGVLPPTEEGLRHFLPGLLPALARLDMGLAEALDLASQEVGPVLSGRRLAINELGALVADRIAPALPGTQRDTWRSPGPYARGQSLGEGVVHFCVRILALQGVVCLAPRTGNRAPFVLVAEWLGRPVPDVDPGRARAELLRRYLRCYGPSTRSGFAAWLGVRPRDTDAWWNLVEADLAEVEYAGTSWILAEDLDALSSTSLPTAVRLLPPRDPFTQMPDRDAIVDRAHHGEIWRAVGEPGTVLADGRIVGTWRPHKNGRTLTVTVRAFGALRARHRNLLEDEAEQVARLRGASRVEVVIDDR
jgi:hypothetical protein